MMKDVFRLYELYNQEDEQNCCDRLYYIDIDIDNYFYCDDELECLFEEY